MPIQWEILSVLCREVFLYSECPLLEILLKSIVNPYCPPSHILCINISFSFHQQLGQTRLTGLASIEEWGHVVPITSIDSCTLVQEEADTGLGLALETLTVLHACHHETSHEVWKESNCRCGKGSSQEKPPSGGIEVVIPLLAFGLAPLSSNSLTMLSSQLSHACSSGGQPELKAALGSKPERKRKKITNWKCSNWGHLREAVLYNWIVLYQGFYCYQWPLQHNMKTTTNFSLAEQGVNSL